MNANINIFKEIEKQNNVEQSALEIKLENNGLGLSKYDQKYPYFSLSLRPHRCNTRALLNRLYGWMDVPDRLQMMLP